MILTAKMKDGCVSERILELAVPQCSADDFDGEIVAINLDTGIYYSIRESAALVWHDLADGHSVETLLDVVREDADGQAAISRFVDELLGSGLMRPSVEIVGHRTRPFVKRVTGVGSLPIARRTMFCGPALSET